MYIHIALYIIGLALLSLIWLVTDPSKPRSLQSIRKLLGQDSTKTGSILKAVIVFQIISGLFFPWPYTKLDDLYGLFGQLVFWFGFGLAVWAKFAMNKNWGTPAQHNIHRQNTLVMTGPFRYTRNPIYLGLSCLTIGTAIGLKSIFLPLVFIFLFHVRRMAIAEELLLLKHFGSPYLKYKEQVPRFLL